MAYTIVELDTLGGEYSEAFAINDSNQIVGRAGLPLVGARACIWQPWGRYGASSLGTAWTGTVPPLQLASAAAGISSNGKIVGWTQKGGPEDRRATLYDGQAIDLTWVLGKPGIALDINPSKRIVGAMGDEPGSLNAFTCDLQSGGPPTTITTGPGTAKAVNGIGQVVGVEADQAYGGWRAFLYHNGQMTYLTPGPGGIGNALDINSSGQVVGEYNFNPFIYSPGGEGLKVLDVDLGIALAINDAGQVVGYGYTSGEKSAWIYSAQDGVVWLDSLLPRDSGWTLSEAHDINNDGSIVGVGQHNGKTRGFLLAPPDLSRPEWWNQPWEIAIDPMALILSGKAYDIWILIHHPHEPKEKIQEKLRSLAPEQRKRVLSRATTLLAYGQSLEARGDIPRVHGLTQLDEVLLSLTNEQRKDVMGRARTVLECGKAIDG